MVQTSGEPAQRLEIDLANHLQIGVFVRQLRGRHTLHATEARNALFHAHRFAPRGDLPVHGTQEHADVPGVQGDKARGDGIGFGGLLEGGENDGVPRYVHDHAARREVGDDLVVALLPRHGTRPGAQHKSEDTKRPSQTKPNPPKAEALHKRPSL